MTKNLSTVNYEGEDLNLTKKDILNVLDQVGQYWSQDRIHNATRLMSLNIFKGLIRMTSARDIEDIWKIQLRFIDELRYQNTLVGDHRLDVLKTVKKSIAEEIFK